MKRAFRLPLTQAILNAQSSQRQVDRLAAPLRRRGAWTQLVEARLNTPEDRKRAPADSQTHPQDSQPRPDGNGTTPPSRKLVRDTHPTLGLKQRLQLIMQRQDQNSERANAPASHVARKTVAARPKPIARESYFDVAFEPNDLPVDIRTGRTSSAPTRSNASPPPPRSPQEPRAVSEPKPKPKQDQDVPSAPVQAPVPAKIPPVAKAPLPVRQATPVSRRPVVRTKSTGATAAAKMRQAMLLELTAPPIEQLSKQPAVAPERKSRILGRFIVLALVATAIGGAVHFRAHLGPLAVATTQAVKNGKAMLFPAPRDGSAQLTLAKATLLESAPIEVISTSPLASSLPSTYGIFASTNGRLIRLEPMNIRLPDSRIALPGLINKPPTVVVPHGRLSFVAYQRELITSAPDNAQLRIVARVARALSFSTNGKATVSAVDDTWAIRAVSVDLTVAPVPENREMVALRIANPDLDLSPGRYLLTFKNQAYDFVVEGKPTDRAHCLEKSETEDGETFAECRKPF